MTSVFAGKTTFNDDISNWDVSNVTTMLNMFNGATSFNKNISSWNVSKVANMTSMFQGATSFNQNLSGVEQFIECCYNGINVPRCDIF